MMQTIGEYVEYDLGMKNRKMKMEKPRPLKISSLADQSMESVLAEMDLVSQHMSLGTCDRNVYPAIAALCENLKMFGPQLENVYKDQLDKCYIALRNGCRDDRLSLAARYRLLEVIELRAMHWQPNENLLNYYKQKLVQIEAEEAAMDEQHELITAPTTPMLITPTGTPGVIFSGQPAFTQQHYNQQLQQQHSLPQTPTPQTPTPSLLGPGEIIRASGKFAKPTRIPGKNYCKDEVVIRNADSGKVMGIKGRRVHMIEELSETIISFQRVAPGARERLVQISGPGEENINQAKHLIEETIRRNASPVRGDERGSIFSSVGGSSSSISSHTSDETLQVFTSSGSRRPGSKRSTLIHSTSMGEESIGDYRYTVTKGNDAIRITGNNLQLVRTAKLVLDEFFNGERNLNNIAILLGPDEKMEPSVHSSAPAVPAAKTSPAPGTPSTETDPTAETLKGVITVLRQPLFPSSSKEAVDAAENSTAPSSINIKNRRANFAKTSEERSLDVSPPSTPGSPTTHPSGADDAVFSTTNASPARLTYTREFLVKCASSPLSRLTPQNWANVVRQTPVVLKKSWQYQGAVVATLNELGEKSLNAVPTYLQPVDVVDAPTLLSRDLRWTLLRTMSTVDDDDNNGNNAAA